MKFNYLARTQKGELQTGIIEANSRESALEILQSHKLVVIRLEEESKMPILARRIRLFDRVSRKDVMIFCRQLAVLIGSDVALVEALRVLGEQTSNKYFKEVIFEVASDVDGGTLFSKALAKHPKVFSSFFINLIKAGEVSGRLQESLEFLAEYLEREYYLISKIRGAMIYPIFVLVAFFLVGILMMTVVIPQLITILEETTEELPLPTRIVIAVSNFFNNYALILGIATVVLIIVLVKFHQTKKGREFFDRLKLKLPILGGLFKKTYLARFTQNLSTLIQGGLPIIQALDVTGDVVGNVVYKKIIFQARDEVKTGHTISEVLERYPEFPPLVTQMIKTGEKTGKIDFVLKNLAKFYSQEVEMMASNLSQLIEPLLILGLGLMVGTLVASILMPIYNIAGSL